jgi:hypothetical protein
VSFNKIGTGKTGAPLILSEFNPAEKMALMDILEVAERGIDSGVVNLGKAEGVARAMISELRPDHEIEG